jgi:hypothetical protein
MLDAIAFAFVTLFRKLIVKKSLRQLNLDIFWLKDESLQDSANLPDPDIIAAEIVEDLQAALA